MREGAIAALLVLAMLAGAGAGYLVGASVPGSQSGKNMPTTSMSTSATCTIPDEGQVLLQVMNGTSGKPIGSAPVMGQLLLLGCSPNTYTAADLDTAMTNATGFVSFEGELGEYHLYFPTLGNYFVDVSMNPGETACVTLTIPNGETDITYSGHPGSSCQPGL